MAGKFEVYQDSAGKFRFRLKATNGQVIAVGQAYGDVDALAVQREIGTFDAYIWGFVSGQTKHNAWTTMKDIPAKTPEAEALSKDLLRRGFKFVGPTICYALMQATGLVNDHTVDCFRYAELRRA